MGAEDPQISAASIIKIETPGRRRALHPHGGDDGGGVSAWRGGHDPQGARQPMGHGAGVCPRPLRRRRSGAHRVRRGLWKRLAYVAITRAENRLMWVVRNRLARPHAALTVADLKPMIVPLSLAMQDSDG